ncbi:hypothetical protein EC957_011080 [Mortierella hygrophila]|uniref:Spp2/MOS2 G-patch domain-containing protein n=1 Tax=Mortierella hygrophila TaxID=979708 RepID=A0A9P6FA35_9FUNG|nr:hypothetical protein EC957_011080 [Mortierella hygrophila]
MSAEVPPPPEGNNGPAPFKMSFGGGAIKGKGKGIARPAAPLVRPTGAFGAASTEAPTEGHVDELIRGVEGNKIESVTPQVEAKALVIPKEENSNWRQEALAKRKRAYLPEGSSATQAHVVTVETEEPEETKIGLQIRKRVKVETNTTDQSSSAMDINVTETTIVVREEIIEDAKEETLEEMAARKVLEAVTGVSGEGSRRLVLLGEDNVHQDEVESFQKNLEQLPDEASLEDYEKVPVEEFGAALLRGMGWKGDDNGSDAIEYNRRPALLGLGAKPREPEPSKKKYIKPGESRIPQSIPVPSRSSTARPSGPSSQRDTRDTRDSRDRDSRDSRDFRDTKDRDERESRGRKDGRDDRDRGDRGGRESRDSRDDRDKRGGSSRDYRDRERDRDRETKDTRDSRDSRRDDRNRDRDRDYRRDDRKDDRRDDRDRSGREDRGGERRRDRSRDREREKSRR